MPRITSYLLTRMQPKSRRRPQSSAASKIKLTLWRSSMAVTMITRLRIPCSATMLLLIRTHLYSGTTPASQILSAIIKLTQTHLTAVLSLRVPSMTPITSCNPRATHIISLITTTTRVRRRSHSRLEAVASYLRACLIEGEWVENRMFWLWDEEANE